jgi:hypothetical protein
LTHAAANRHGTNCVLHTSRESGAVMKNCLEDQTFPLDSRWDRLIDDDWSDFARAWVEELRFGDPDGDEGYGQSVTQMSFTARPQQQWKFILASISHAESEEELGHIAAGPIEHLLGWHGEKYIEKVENQAATNAKFARAMTGVWQYRMSDEIWARVRAIQEKAKSIENRLGADR